jgi:ATP-dependent Clp protease ATP-binding subunit ClpA
MKKTVVLFVLIFGLVSYGFAQMHDCGEGRKMDNPRGKKHPMMQKRNMGAHFQMLKTELELTDEQVKMMEKTKLDTEKEIATLEAQLKIAQMEHQAAMKDHDYKKAKTHSAKMADVKKDIAAKRIELREKHWNMLNKEQQQKWEDLKLEPHPGQHEHEMNRPPRRK